MVSPSFKLLLISLCWIFSLLVTCSGQDRITPNDPVKANETIISIGETFALGFFTPGNSSNRYVGIWYNKIPGPTVVWVANRDNPVPDSSGSLAIAQDGNLVIMDGKNNTLWRTKLTGAITSNEDVSAVLLQSGNLVLRHRNETLLWESFNYPTNTFLPGMKLRLNLTTRDTWRLRSWKDTNDPSPGAFSASMEIQGPLAQLVIWNATDRFWRSGVIWNGEMLNRLTQNAKFMSYLTVLANDQEVYVTLSISDDSIRTRFVLTPTGRVQQLSWQEGSKKWERDWWSHSQRCNDYNFCGPFGSCNMNGLGTGCDCLKGYVPKNQEEWDKDNYSSGCVRRRELDCANGGDEFYQIDQSIHPDLPVIVGKSSIRECENLCKRDCSCVAYAFANVTWANSTCLTWVGQLTDIRGVDGHDQTFYLRLDSSDLGPSAIESSKRRGVSMILPILTVGLFVCLLGSIIYCLWLRQHKPESERECQVARLHASDSKDVITSEVQLFQFHNIVMSTNNFDEANKLGQGGFGPVYKGKLHGQDVAVKRLSESSGQGLTELRNEVELIAKIQHKNLVRLLGWCIHGEEKMLIYEYLRNKSLDKFLFDATQKALLSWKMRFNIIEGIAQGLLYLHRYSRLKIIHRDLKASNILLDADMNPKISDFGMARIFGGSQVEANTNRVVGTYGYMAPEYALHGNFSEKSDVFSFGVLLIEIVTGKKNTGFYTSQHSTYLLENAWHLWVEGRWMELMDPVYKESFDAHQVLKCINLGLLCVQVNANDRPSMSTTISMLGSDNATLPDPKMPAFSNFIHSYMGSPGTAFNGYSVNQVTLSSVAPR